MAIKSKESDKWLAIIDGTVMVDLINDQWKPVEFNSEEEAEKAERKYNEFWEK